MMKLLSIHARIVFALCLGCAVSLGPKTGLADGTGASGIVLLDHHGHERDISSLKGQPAVVSFGFLNCPDICPTTLSYKAQVIDALEGHAREVNFIFISVDPDRDGPADLKAYTGAFHSRILGLTGSEGSLRKFASSMGARFQKTPLSGTDYAMAHPVISYVLDTKLEKVGTIYFGPDAEIRSVTTRLTSLLQKSRKSSGS